MSHTNLLYHIIFGTKERFPFITNKLKPRLHEYLGGTVRGLDSKAFIVNGMSEHVHLLVKLKSSHRLDYFVRDLKSNSSKWAKNEISKNFSWRRRYGAFTVSESQFSTVENYIRNQEEHHAKFDFRKEYESLLTANKLEIDEFVWQD